MGGGVESRCRQVNGQGKTECDTPTLTSRFQGINSNTFNKPPVLKVTGSAETRVSGGIKAIGSPTPAALGGDPLNDILEQITDKATELGIPQEMVVPILLGSGILLLILLVKR